jgi:alpha,alpha-trehalose phosphorylase
MRDHDGQLTFAPRLPSRLGRLSFRLVFRGRRLKVDVNRTHAVYTLLDGTPLEIQHHGQEINISRAKPLERPIPPAAERPTPDQPPGRAPRRRAEALVT